MRRQGPWIRAASWLAGGLLAVLCALPVGYLIVKACYLDSHLWASVLFSPATWQSLANTLKLAFLSAALALLLATPLAWLTFACDLPARRFFRVVLVLPLAVPSYVGAFVVLLLFGAGGLLAADPYGLGGALLALTFTYPLALLTIEAALARIDPRQWEAARSLGLAPWRAFALVVLPQMKSALAAGALFVGLYAIGDFGAVSMLRYDSLSFVIYLRQKSLFGGDESVILSLLLVALTTLLVIFFVVLGGRATRELRSERQAWPTVRLGRWKWPATLFCSAIAGFFVLSPVLVVGYWLYRGLRLSHDLTLPVVAAWTSLWLGGLAALVIVWIALIPGVLARLHPLGRSVSRAAAYASYALPGIVVALALVALAATWAQPIYQTLLLLLVAYLIRFFPLAVATLDDAMRAQAPDLVWAARSLGKSPLLAFFRVVVPVARPAFVAALLVVFIAVMKELPATLLLRPLDFRTLATDIWLLTEDGYFSAAAGSVLIMMALAVLGLVARPAMRQRKKAV